VAKLGENLPRDVEISLDEKEIKNTSEILNPVYAIEPVDSRLYRVNKHPTGCQRVCQTGLYNRFNNRLSNRFDNRYDNRLYCENAA